MREIIHKIAIKNFILKINFKLLKNLFFLISILYFIFYSILNFNQISLKIDLDKNGYQLLLSIILSFFSIFLNAFGWKNIIIWFGNRNKIDNIISLFIFTNSLKYVPGGIWHFVERFTYLKKNINVNIAFYTVLVEPYFMLAAALLMSSIGVLISPIYILLIIPSIFLNRSYIYFIIYKLESLKNSSITSLKFNNNINEFKKSIRLKTFIPFKPIIIECLFVLFKFFSFIICFKLNNFQIDSIIFLFVVFCLAWSVGLIIPAAPGGLGVFEACFLFLAGDIYAHSSIISSLLIFRLVSTFADLSLSAPYLLNKFTFKT